MASCADQSSESTGLTTLAAAVGQALFEDPRFSSDGRISCASCHKAEHAFADNVALSKGVWGRQTARNTPTLIGLPQDIPLMWDGGVTPLRHGSQGILAALTAHRDQDMNPVDLDRKLQHFTRYKVILNRLYPGQPLAAGYLLAIREYVKEIGHPMKKEYPSTEHSSIRAHTAPHRNTEQGLALFKGKAGCIRCHHGPSLTDGRFYNLGVDSSDPGRAAISLLEEDRGRFRTPPLVLLSKTAPYFHNGSVATLENVLQHYTEGAGEAGRIHLNPEEKQALLAFLRTL
ncbi:MAG: cytochrome-c peroxidase [Bacteroidota bacterium]